MHKKNFIGLAIFAIIFIAVSAALSGVDKKQKNELYHQVELFSDALAIIQSDYVEEPKPKDLIYGALKGMLAALDAHSQFLDPDAYNELKVDTQGKFGGVGIEITIKDGLLTVITPIEDTPAWKAGIKSGDSIVKIENELTRDMTISEAVKRMRGKVGEAVNLTILRESEKKLLEFKIVRDIIKIKDIKEARILEDGIGYIRLVEFRENTPQDIGSTLEKLQKEGMNALILDLRNNPGGLLNTAAEVTGMFLEKGKIIVYTKGRKPSQDLEFSSRYGRPFLDMPMIVLINEGSASGSEIVAAALQDYKRAIILGAKSFGKGSVQTVVPLGDGSALRLTTSKYFSPLGKEIHGKGVIPDILVEGGLLEVKKGEDISLIDPEGGSQKTEEKKDKALDYRQDNQLIRAVDVLKAIKIYKKNI